MAYQVVFYGSDGNEYAMEPYYDTYEAAERAIEADNDDLDDDVKLIGARIDEV